MNENIFFDDIYISYRCLNSLVQNPQIKHGKNNRYVLPTCDFLIKNRNLQAICFCFEWLVGNYRLVISFRKKTYKFLSILFISWKNKRTPTTVDYRQNLFLFFSRTSSGI